MIKKLFFGAIMLAFSTLPLVSCAKSEPKEAPQGGTIKPQLFQEFMPGWNNKTAQDGLWKINGPWIATGKNLMFPGNVTFSESCQGETNKGFMYLSST